MFAAWNCLVNLHHIGTLNCKTARLFYFPGIHPMPEHHCVVMVDYALITSQITLNFLYKLPAVLLKYLVLFLEEACILSSCEHKCPTTAFQPTLQCVWPATIKELDISSAAVRQHLGSTIKSKFLWHFLFWTNFWSKILAAMGCLRLQ